jgi:hypothetical protein
MWLELVEHSRNVHRQKINNQRGDFYKVNKEVSSARFEEHIFIYRALAGKCNTSFFLHINMFSRWQTYVHVLEPPTD